MFFPIGAIFRRCWGGWHVPPHIVKVIIGYVLAYLLALFVTHNLWAATAFSATIGTSFLNPLHSWGMGMGYDDGSRKSTLACAAVMGGSYGAFTALAAVLVWYITGMTGCLWFGIMGFLTPVAYILGWIFAIRRGYLTDPTKMQFFNIFGQWFIDSPTAIGECFLGALLLSLWNV